MSIAAPHFHGLGMVTEGGPVIRLSLSGECEKLLALHQLLGRSQLLGDSVVGDFNIACLVDHDVWLTFTTHSGYIYIYDHLSKIVV